MRALEMAPRVSGGVAHAMAVSVGVGAGNRAAPVHEGGDLCRGCGPRIGATFIRTIWSRSCGKSWSPSRTDPHVMTRPRYGVCVACNRCSFEVSNVSPIRATLETSAITQLMFDLCSAPCKARRFAPPAHARGLRALTVPARRSGLGHYVMAGGVMTLSWTDLDR